MIFGNHFVPEDEKYIEESTDNYPDFLLSEGKVDLGLDKGTKDSIDKWVTSNSNHDIQKFYSSHVEDKDYVEIKEALDTMKKTNDYPKYKKAFDKFCKICHIVPRGVIITKYKVKKGKEENRNTIDVEYSFNTKKIKLPDDCKLYHMSKVEGIKELRPQFKGKSERGYLYDKARVYLTIRKNMPKFLADYKATDRLHKYQVVDPIKEVYVDPLVWLKIQGAVYVETTTPIKVVDITDPDFMADIGDAMKVVDKGVKDVADNTIGKLVK